MLLMVLVSTAPPSAASIPKLGLFYAFNILIIVLSLCLSAIVINVSKLGDKGCRVPKLIDKVSNISFYNCCWTQVKFVGPLVPFVSDNSANGLQNQGGFIVACSPLSCALCSQWKSVTYESSVPDKPYLTK